ncbi:MAG: thioredoxin domain-containing protein [Thermoleophilaceae bacterium]|nr:thioredoxin domain-containing protein [Thermoleophilaceae bacterium]
MLPREPAMEQGTATRKQRREQAREERLRREAEAAARSERRRRLALLGGVLAVAAVAVAIAIVVSSSGSDSGKGRGHAGVRATQALFAGIPQHGIALGDPKAPVTVEEYADLQCPFCREYTLGAFPTLVREYVRTGKVRMVFRTLAFIGPDSVTAGHVAQAAAAQNRLWNFVDRFYANQERENTGYVTRDFLTKVADEVPGLDRGKLFAAADAPAAQQGLVDAQRSARSFGIDSTPSFVVGRTGRRGKVVQVGSLTDPAAFRSAIDPLLE